MLKLHGVAVSNYYSMVKLALLEKGIDFEEVRTPPSQEPEFLQMSPLGKIPCIETPNGFLSESVAIIEYLEDLDPEPPLYPLDAFESGKVRQLVQLLVLYVEMPVRRLLNHVFFGGDLADYTRQEVQEALDRSLPALQRAAKFSPYVTGGTFTAADIVCYYTGILVTMMTEKVYGTDRMLEVEGYSDWLAVMRQRPKVQEVDTCMHETMKTFFDNKS
ncbi:glutathione S-transferase family protein [Porticoccaceae bacterium LTM1]|nr:glutathione S-transferase family protein [Porticoccaceae bacterium LTM1]